MDSESQRDKILQHMIAGNSITGLDALNLFGCMSLPKRICEINKILFEEGLSQVKKSWYKTASGKQVRKYFL